MNDTDWAIILRTKAWMDRVNDIALAVAGTAVVTRVRHPEVPNGTLLTVQFENIIAHAVIFNARRSECGFVKQTIKDLFKMIAHRRVENASQG